VTSDWAPPGRPGCAAYGKPGGERSAAIGGRAAGDRPPRAAPPTASSAASHWTPGAGHSARTPSRLQTTPAYADNAGRWRACWMRSGRGRREPGKARKLRKTEEGAWHHLEFRAAYNARNAPSPVPSRVPSGPGDASPLTARPASRFSRNRCQNPEGRSSKCAGFKEVCHRRCC
jgi:hypothetical protein